MVRIGIGKKLATTPTRVETKERKGSMQWPRCGGDVHWSLALQMRCNGPAAVGTCFAFARLMNDWLLALEAYDSKTETGDG